MSSMCVSCRRRHLPCIRYTSGPNSVDLCNLMLANWTGLDLSGCSQPSTNANDFGSCKLKGLARFTVAVAEVLLVSSDFFSASSEMRKICRTG